jgi:hypothetical protein
VDFIVVWLIPLDVWYIIPIAVAKTTSLYLRPEKPKHGRRWGLERYRNNWGLLERASQRRRLRRGHGR